MCETSALVECLFRRQNADGGWSYNHRGNSWTEPTSLAMLALESARATVAPYQRACDWLLRRQRSDGGWPPNDAVNTSVSVGSLASLAISSQASQERYRRSIVWIIGQMKPDLGFCERFEYWVENIPAREMCMGGSPWFPGTAAWVAPTVCATLALADARRHLKGVDLDPQIRRGKSYLLSRQCSDGGWNHGGTEFRSPNATSYPEMTGMALLALDGVRSAQVHTALLLARGMYQSPGSAEAQAWLALALAKHRQSTPIDPRPLPCRTTRDLSLQLLALTAQSPTNKLQTPTG